MRILKLIIPACLAASVTGCASQVTYGEHGAQTTSMNFPLTEWPLNEAGPVKSMMIDRGIPKSSPITVASFANIDNLTEVSSLGRYLGEFFANELVDYGYSVYDLDAQDEIMLMKHVGAIYRTRQGELSKGSLDEIVRTPDLVRKGVRYVLTGTYTLTQDHVVVQARLIDMIDHKMASSVALSMPRQGMIAELANRHTADEHGPVGAVQPVLQQRRLEVVGP
jgi:flagellar FlgO protein